MGDARRQQKHGSWTIGICGKGEDDARAGKQGVTGKDIEKVAPSEKTESGVTWFLQYAIS